MRYYRLKYRLSIKHSADDNREHMHSHVIEIEVYARVEGEDFIEFLDMDKMLRKSLDGYQHKYINDIAEFMGNATIEGIGETLYRRLDDIFTGSGWIIARLSVSETPLRTYSIVAEEI